MALPQTLTLVYHAVEPHPREVPLEEVYRTLTTPGASDRPRVILNMVQTLDGAVAINGKAWGIGSEVDHYLFRTLRGWADVILSGAGTLRLNDIVATTHPHLQVERAAAGRPVNPAAVVASRRAEFDDQTLRKRFFLGRDFSPIVLTTEHAREEDRRRVEDAGAEVWIVPAGAAGEVDVRAALSLLAQRGMTRVLAEGGPTLNRRLVDAALLDELFLTVSPRVAGVPGPNIIAGILGGGRLSLALISEFHYRAPEVRELYVRFAARA
jgi:riboflavin biosynthesis pyrimidine reductase